MTRAGKHCKSFGKKNGLNRDWENELNREKSPYIEYNNDSFWTKIFFFYMFSQETKFPQGIFFLFGKKKKVLAIQNNLCAGMMVIFLYWKKWFEIYVICRYSRLLKKNNKNKTFKANKKNNKFSLNNAERNNFITAMMPLLSGSTKHKENNIRFRESKFKSGLSLHFLTDFTKLFLQVF